MFVKPSSAFVGKPSLVASSSSSAKKARYARLFPSTRKRSDSRAGASSRSSSTPVSVFGLTGRGYRPRAMELRGDDEIWLDPAEADRYGELCDEHVRSGRLAHFVLVDADAPLLDRWYGLSFGRQQVYAAAPVGAAPYDGPLRVRPGDLETALELSAVMFD